MRNLKILSWTFIILLFASLPITYAQATGGGFTVTGVSLINVLHPGQLLNATQPASQAKWVITTVFNGGGQSLVATLSNTSINYRDSQGRLITSNYPLQISGITNPETAIYTISNNQPEPIYEFYSRTYVGTYNYGYFGGSSGTTAPQCPTPYYLSYVLNKTITTGPYTITVARICVYEQQIAAEYPISLADTQFSSVLTLNANGQQETLNLNSNETSAISQDQLVQAQWVGSLVTGTQAPTGSQSVAISNLQNNQWGIQNINEYSGTQGYASFIPTPATFANIGSSCTFTPTTYSPDNNSVELANFANCMNITAQNDYSINNQHASQLLGPTQPIQGYTATQTNYNRGTAFAISLGSGTFTTNPEIIFTLSGSFVGVVIPVGKPKILSVSTTPFTSGSTGTIKISVQNIGDAQGSFYPTLSNCQGVSPVQSSINYQVQPGQSQQINLSIITSGINQVLNQQCTVTVTDYNGGGSDTAQVNVVSKSANQCTPNSQILQGQSYCPCLNQSGVWKPGTGTACTTCQYGVQPNGPGVYGCAPPPSTTTILSQQKTTINQSIPTTTIYAYNYTISHVDVVIVTIGSKLGEDSNYKTSLSNYENLLTSEGLSYSYIELDSYNPSMNVNDWQSVKTSINRIEYLTNPTYLIILGNENIIPMPNVTSSVPFDEQGYNPYTIYTDDPYGSLTNSAVPTIVVARIPGSNADQIATILNNDIKRHSENNNNLMISGDGLNDSHDAFIGIDVNTFSQITTGSSCANNPNCLNTPPNCLGSSCTSASSFQNDISSVYGIQYYDCHGSGYTCGAWSGNYTTLASYPYYGLSLSIPQLNTNPIVMSSACYDGITQPSNTTLYYYRIPPITTTLALQMLENGASVYIGNTKEGYGYYTPTNLEYVYSNFKSGDTIGQAFLAMKQKFLTNPLDAYQAGTAQELQLYGDPTITYGG